MTSDLQLWRTTTTGNRPGAGTRPFGTPYINIADNQFGVMDSGNNARDLIGVPFFSSSANYAAGQAVVYSGKIYIATASVAAGAFNPLQWTQLAAVQDVPASAIGSGQLQYVNASSLQYKPFFGNTLKINGIVQTIPTSGIVGLSNTAVYVNGVAGQNLAGGTVYFVYAWMNGSIMTADFRTVSTFHATSTTPGNVGTEILQGDDTRSLIGMIATIGGTPGTFGNTGTIRYVRSWFNPEVYFVQGSALNEVGIVSTSFVGAGSIVYFVNWANELCVASFSGYISNGVAGGTTSIAFMLSGSVFGGSVAGAPGVGGQGYFIPATNVQPLFPTEAVVHYIDIGAAVGSGQQGWISGATTLQLLGRRH